MTFMPALQTPPAHVWAWHWSETCKVLSGLRKRTGQEPFTLCQDILEPASPVIFTHRFPACQLWEGTEPRELVPSVQVSSPGGPRPEILRLRRARSYGIVSRCPKPLRTRPQPRHFTFPYLRSGAQLPQRSPGIYPPKRPRSLGCRPWLTPSVTGAVE